MGFRDRDYYREDPQGWLPDNRTRMTIILIVINVVCLMIQFGTREGRGGFLGNAGWFTDAFALDVDRVMRGEVWRLMTYGFLHSTSALGHILFNMLFLWMFGSRMEDIYGGKEFLAFYLAALLVSGIGYTAMTFAIPDTKGVAMGASGAVSAVLVLFAMHFPKQVIYLFFILPIPIWFLVAFSIVKDLLTLFGKPDTPIAVAAHLAGAAFGWLYYIQKWRVSNWIPNFQRNARGTAAKPRRRNAPQLRVYQADDDRTDEVPALASPPPRVLDEQLEAKMDEILEKIRLQGQASLTPEEREILNRAGELIRKRLKPS